MNGYVETFNGRMGEELLNESLFLGLGPALPRMDRRLQYIPAALVARIPHPGSLCRDYRRNRLQRCAR